LNVLNFRNLKKFRINADIRINGKRISAKELISRSAYVQQDDLFISNLTVLEHLTFVAMLKIGSNFTNREKRNRVNEIIEEFNLEKCKHTKIGSHDNKKGISGGEKRRLSFASEVRKYITVYLFIYCN
jgi:ABC-type multidrug transport system ATPase subunit